MIENILLILLLLLLTAKIVGGLFQKIGWDSSLGELLTGIAFGPSLLNMIDAKSIESFALIGSVFILFIAGMKQRDIEGIGKDKPALMLGIILLFVTGILMTAFFYFIPPYFNVHLNVLQASVMGLAFAIIDIGVPAKVMISNGMMNTPAGKITIRSAIVNIILGLVVFTILSLLIAPRVEDIVLRTAGIILFIAITIGLIYFLSRITRLVMKVHIEEAEFSLALILVLALAYITEVIGFSSILGAFIGGVLIAQLSFAETKSFSDKIKSISFGLFIPLFFVWFGLSIELKEIWKHIALAGLIFVVYIAIRFAITYIFIKKQKMDMPGLISSSMLSVDIESLVILMVALQIGIFTTNTPLTLFAPSVFLSTLLIVVLVVIFRKIEGKKQAPAPADAGSSNQKV